MAGEPMFYPLLDLRDRKHYEEWIANKNNCLWIALQNREVVGYMKYSPSMPNSTIRILRDPKTIIINGAYTRPEHRRRKIASALLQRLLSYARQQGFERCCVDFESPNIHGGGFWISHFTPVCYSLIRRIDERIAWANKDPEK